MGGRLVIRAEIGGRRNPAVPDARPGRTSPEREGGGPATGRPNRRLLRASRPDHFLGHAGGLAARRRQRRAGPQCRTLGRDHRLPVRLGARHPDGPCRCVRSRGSVGHLLQGVRSVETSGQVDIVLFDKTGTITDGQMSVVDFAAAPGSPNVTSWGPPPRSEQASEHPVGRGHRESRSGDRAR